MMLMLLTRKDQLLFTPVAGECTYTALVSLSVVCVCVCVCACVCVCVCEIRVQYFIDVVLMVCKGVCISCSLF